MFWLMWKDRAIAIEGGEQRRAMEPREQSNGTHGVMNVTNGGRRAEQWNHGGRRTESMEKAEWALWDNMS